MFFLSTWWVNARSSLPDLTPISLFSNTIVFDLSINFLFEFLTESLSFSFGTSSSLFENLTEAERFSGCFFTPFFRFLLRNFLNMFDFWLLFSIFVGFLSGESIFLFINTLYLLIRLGTKFCFSFCSRLSRSFFVFQ